jgi:FlaA1/EpsC-like NDP-sugar epimerase
MLPIVRFILLVLGDAVLVNISFICTLLFRFEGHIPVGYRNAYFQYAFVFTFVFIACNFLFGLYRRVIKYASIGELVVIFKAVSVGMITNILLVLFLNNGVLPFPRSVLIVNWFMAIVMIGCLRLAWRLLRDHGLKINSSVNGKPVLIVGAGDAGVMVAKELKSHYNGSINIVGFVDDDPLKQKALILNIPILGTRNDIPDLAERYDVQEIILALPSAGGQVIKEIVNHCKKTRAKIKILPGVYDLLDGRVTINNIREVEVEDLLGREPVKVDLDGIAGYIMDQVILVTGGGGSIGSELCRQVSKYSPKTLLVLDVCENNVYDIEMELRKSYPELRIVPLVKDVRDRKSMERIFKIYRPQVVFHAAAHKHVPLMEANPEEAIKNNVMGTFNVARAADLFGSKRFVLISTDKAVNPTSIMGSSKRLAEILIQYYDTISKTSYVAVRFGNVLGSRGSVIPLFKKQIVEGGPVTVTHEEMVRYFMTIPEAVQLVIQAGAIAHGGEIFVLDMGDPVKIMDLAKSLIELSGFEPEKDIKIKITGMRPGEKLYEELLTAEEGVKATTHKRIFVAKPNGMNVPLIEDMIGKIMNGQLPSNEDETVQLIRTFLPTFRRSENEKESEGVKEKESA